MTEHTSSSVAPLKIKGAKTTVLLGFLSLVGCVFYAIPGTVIALLGIRNYKRCKAVYLMDPKAYERSFADARAGLIVSVAGLVLSVVTLIWTLSLFWPLWFGKSLF